MVRAHRDRPLIIQNEERKQDHGTAPIYANPENRAEVRSLAECGASDEDVAAKLQLPIKKLRRLFKVELEQGVAQGNREVLDALYQSAKSGSNMAATIFWTKARCGWRDTGAPADAASRLYCPLIIRYAKK